MLEIERVLDIKEGMSSNGRSVESKLDSFYAKLESIGINLTEIKPILESESPVNLIVSGAGSGKTTLLILWLIRKYLVGGMLKKVRTDVGYIEVPCSVMVCTFLRSGAKDLRRSLYEWLKRLDISGFPLDAVDFTTIHARAKRDIELMGARFTLVESPYRYVERVASSMGFTAQNGGTLTFQNIQDLTGLLMYYRNMLDSKRYENMLSVEYGVTGGILDDFVANYKYELESKNMLDFESIQEALLSGAESNENVRNFIGGKYDYILVDEFQDASQLQYELLKLYFKGAKSILVIGDDDQCIYSFRGSDVDIILKRFTEDYGGETHYLTTNHRCPSNFVSGISSSISRNIGRCEKELRSSRVGGIYSTYGVDEFDRFISSVREDIAKGYSVGIMGRTNESLVQPIVLLLLAGVQDFSVSSGVRLDSGVARLVFSVTKLLTTRYNDDFYKILQLYSSSYSMFKGKGNTVRGICDALKQSPEVSLDGLDIETVNQIDKGLAELVGILQSEETDIRKLELLLGVLVSNGGGSIYANKVANFAEFILGLIEFGYLEDMNIDDIDFFFNSTIPSAFASALTNDGKTAVRIPTIHDAKGKEWDSVYVWDDSEGVFPLEASKRGLTSSEFEEERRIHYVACTRAKKKLTILKRGSGGKFFKECTFVEGGVDEKTVEGEGTASVGVGGTTSNDDSLRVEFRVEKKNSKESLTYILETCSDEERGMIEDFEGIYGKAYVRGLFNSCSCDRMLFFSKVESMIRV